MATHSARPVAFALALMMGAVALAPAGASATAPAATTDHEHRTHDGHDSNDHRLTGVVTFMRQDEAGHWQTWVATADLRRQRQLTGEDANSGWPVLAPHRPLIAFDTDRTDPDPTDDLAVNDIFVVHADGNGLRRITDSVGVSSDPGWSPSGRMIAMSADRGDYPTSQGIYVARSDGTRLRRLTTLPEGAGVDTAPRFSPSGRHLVFTRYQEVEGQELGALFVVSIRGNHERQLTPFSLNAGDATWSPDGRTLAFEAFPDPGSRGDIFTVGADGRHLRNVTRNDPRFSGSADPVWSPDGRQIMFLSGTRVTEDVGLTEGLAVMTRTGRDRRYVAEPAAEHQPDWRVYGHRHDPHR
jgi:Tol biopolymer transport system component